MSETHTAEVARSPGCTSTDVWQSLRDPTERSCGQCDNDWSAEPAAATPISAPAASQAAEAHPSQRAEEGDGELPVVGHFDTFGNVLSKGAPRFGSDIALVYLSDAQARIDALKAEFKANLDSMHKQYVEQALTIARLTRELEEARAERDAARSDADQSEQRANEADDAVSWSEWAEAILKDVRSFSGYDGYDDPDGVDLPAEVHECLAELSAAADRARDELSALKAARDADQPRGLLPEVGAL